MRFYRSLLWFCPASFREEYSREMEAVHRKRLRQATGPGKILVWLDAIGDITVTGLTTHWDLLMKDIRFAIRTAWRAPGFSIAAIAVAALGIAAATAVFSVADHVLVRPFPYADPERMVTLWEDQSAFGFSRNFVSPPDYRDWKEASTSFSSLAAFRGLSVNLSGSGEPERLEGTAANANMFSLLGVTPLIGRTMTEEEDRPGAPGTVVLSYGFWQRRFAGDAAALGKSLLLDGKPHTIIGVMPANFYFPTREKQIWTALRLQNEEYSDRRNYFLAVVGRLRDGVTLAQAQQEMRSIGARLAAQYPADLAKISVSVISLRDDVSRPTRLLLSILMAAALFVLLIAITNLANLFLARSASRQTEIAVRLALGAGRGRLVRQLLTESVLLASVGGLIGTGLSVLGVPLLSRLVPTGLPIAATPAADWRLLAFALLATTLTAVAFGMIPALRATRGSLATRSATGLRRDSVRRLLVVAQVAASIALISSTGLLLQALLKLQQVDPGFKTANAFAFQTSLPMPKYEQTAVRERYYRQVLAEVRALPGVRAASVTSFRPMGDFRGGMWKPIVNGQDSKVHAAARFVTPGYFASMGISLVRGRDVMDSDHTRTQPVAVVSESFVQKNWPGEDGLGKTFGIRFNEQIFTVVGVAKDVRFRGIDRPSEPQMYFAHAQMLDGMFSWFAPKDFIVSAAVDPLTLMPAIRRIIAQADPLQPISDVQSLTALVEEETAVRRTQIWVIGLFAAVAIGLAAVGIHGLLSFSVAQRVQEIGLRRALGAQGNQIAKLVFGEGLLLALAGSVVGIAAALALGKSMESFLFGVSPADPGAMLIAAGLAAAMTLAGSLLPTIRAVLIDPASALQHQ